MANEDGSLQVVFNGEIYNHAEIRRGARGARRPPLAHRPLRHRGDPPRVRAVGHRLPAPLPRHVRPRALGRARAASCGSSATASASSRSTTASTTAGSTFASEIKALLAGSASRRGRSTRRRSIHYLSFLTTPAPQTLFDGIRKLAGRAPGCASRADGDDPRAALLGRLGRRRRRSTACREDEIAERVLDELRTSVQPAQGERRAGRRLPLGRHRLEHERGALLGRRERRRSRRSRSATTATTRRYKNELHYARQMAERGRRRPPRAPADAATTCSTSCRGWCSSRTSRSPIRSASRSTTSRSSRATTASSSCQVGEGADELFCGYPSWKTLLRAAALRRPAGAARR